MLDWWSSLAPRQEPCKRDEEEKDKRKLSQIEIYNRNTESLLVQLWCRCSSELAGGKNERKTSLMHAWLYKKFLKNRSILKRC